jgi:ubiquinone/menaquinone biosynthesis C-methylase UbiE
MDNSLKHTIIYNNYISVSLLKLFKDNTKLKNYLYTLIRYSFTDINIKQSKIIINKIIKLINNYENDNTILKNIYDWYTKIPKKDIIGFPTSNEEYIKFKVETMSKIIKKKNLDKIKNTLLFDIGAGDCTITKAFGDYNNMVSVGIDIKSDIDWGSAGKNTCDYIKHIYYKGNDLDKVYKKKFNDKKIGLIMYNHSLHHFGSFENIYNSLKQSYKILQKGGILFIREHNNKSNDIDINLQHILLSLRYTIDHYSNWKYDQIWKYFKNFIYTYSSHFFSNKFLIKICEEIGFTLIDCKKNAQLDYIDYTDISRTYLFSFKK